jgi:hypothetical protein
VRNRIPQLIQFILTQAENRPRVRVDSRAHAGLDFLHVNLGCGLDAGVQMPEIASNPAPSVPANAPADPLKKPTQPILSLFRSTIGAPETKPKETFVWGKTKGIE